MIKKINKNNKIKIINNCYFNQTLLIYNQTFSEFNLNNINNYKLPFNLNIYFLSLFSTFS